MSSCGCVITASLLSDARCSPAVLTNGGHVTLTDVVARAIEAVSARVRARVLMAREAAPRGVPMA